MRKYNLCENTFKARKEKRELFCSLSVELEKKLIVINR